MIFFSSLLNTSLISLAERRREVATLRVLGYTEWQVGGLFFRESMLINVLGTLFGLPLGYGLSRYLAVMYNTECSASRWSRRRASGSRPSCSASCSRSSPTPIVQRSDQQTRLAGCLKNKGIGAFSSCNPLVAGH